MKPSVSTALKEKKLFGMNGVIHFLTLSDVVILGSSNLLAPVFALFVVERINGGNAAVIGLATAVYFAAKALGQIPVAKYTDRIGGERDDWWFMVVGTLIGALLPLGYLFITEVWQLFAIHFLLGLCNAASYPTYMAIFTRHIDQHHESSAWGVRFSLLDLTNVLTASVGGVIALKYGFTPLILIHVALNAFGTALLFPLRRRLLGQDFAR